MATISIGGPALGSGLQALLMCDDIMPGDALSYATAKVIYSFHPLGAKLAEIPIKLAQSKPRIISIPNAPEGRVRKAFLDEWRQVGADKHLFNLHRTKRIYGIASIALLDEGEPSQPVDYANLWQSDIAFNVLDPLNTAGSLVGDLNPNSPGFLKTTTIAVNGRPYHRSRTIIAMNEEPIYLEYTTSAFGYVGRSVYQRTLYPLKSFIETMITDAMVARKAGVIVAKMNQAGSIIDNVMDFMFQRKRDIVKDAATGNVVGIAIEESIESLNLQNVNGAMDASRKHILENIAAGAGMPAILVNSETYAEGFGEGTEDAKAVADYIEREREDMNPSYAWMDDIVQRRAWNPEFYKTIQAEFPEQYGGIEYQDAFYRWKNSFTAEWQSLLTEPDSKKAEVEDVRLKAVIALVEVLLPEMDPTNRAIVIQWAADNFNAFKMLFDVPLDLDYESLAEYTPPEPLEEPHPGHPFAAQDADIPSTLKHLIRPKVAA